MLSRKLVSFLNNKESQVTNQKSPQSRNLVQSLVEFHQSVQKIIKDKENPFHRSKYADLSTVIETVKPSMNDAGLVVVQPIVLKKVFSTESDATAISVMVLLTRLIHESGESIDSEMIIPHQPDPQKLGSLITYYRRYAYLSIIGLASQSDDDDANSSSNKGVRNDKQKNHWENVHINQGSQESFKQETLKESDIKKESSHQAPKGNKASPAQVNALRNIFKADFKADWENITSKEASDLIKQGNINKINGK